MFDLIYADAASSVRKVPSPSAMRKKTQQFHHCKMFIIFYFFKNIDFNILKCLLYFTLLELRY